MWAERVTNSEPNNMMLAYRLNDLMEKLAETPSQADLEPLLVAAREKGYLRRED